MKHKKDFNHEHEIVCDAKCREESCAHGDVDESGKKVSVLVKYSK